MQGFMEGGISMEARHSSFGYFAKRLFFGSLLGGIAGLLLAPKTGKEFRREIKEKASETWEEGRQFYSESSSKAKAIVENAKHRAEELKKEADRQLFEARMLAREILSCRGKTPVVGNSPEEPTWES
jgi:vacuolar-type H+-ATPase subunit H